MKILQQGSLNGVTPIQVTCRGNVQLDISPDVHFPGCGAILEVDGRDIYRLCIDEDVLCVVCCPQCGAETDITQEVDGELAYQFVAKRPTLHVRKKRLSRMLKDAAILKSLRG